MLQRFFQEQGTCFFQLLQGDVIGILVEDAVKVGPVFLGQNPLVSDRCKDRQVVFQTKVVVIVTIARCRVDQTGPGIGRNVVRGSHENIAVNVRVLGNHPVQVIPGKVLDDFKVFPAQFVSYTVEQVGSDNELTVIISWLHHGVVKLTVDGHGFRSGNGPRGRRPDNQVGVVIKDALAILDLFRKEGRLSNNIMVFNFGFGQCRFRRP